MKKDWELKKLGELCSFIGDGDWIESGDQSTKGIRLVQTGNVGEGIYLDKENRAHYISEETFTRLKCTEIFPGDCLISRLPEPVGRACIIPDLNQKMITAVDCTIIRFKENIQPQYFVYYSQSNKYLSDIDSEATGATRKRISRKNLEKINIPLPPLEEQKRIVKILNEKFAQLETIKANAQTNLQNAKDLFQSQLTKAFSNTTWEKKRLDELCSRIFAGGDKPQIVSKEISETCQIPIYANGITDDGLYGYTNEATVFDKSLTISARGTIGFTCIRTKPFVPIVRLLVLIPNDKINISYLKYGCDTLTITNTGSSIPQLTVPMIKDYKIPLPPLPEQKCIVKELDTLSEKVHQLQEIYTKQIANCDELKQSLLQKAFEGEL